MEQEQERMKQSMERQQRADARLHELLDLHALCEWLRHKTAYLPWYNDLRYTEQFVLQFAPGVDVEEVKQLLLILGGYCDHEICYSICTFLDEISYDEIDEVDKISYDEDDADRDINGLGEDNDD